ncbi:hypothetical protein EB796_004668 [Bugula neritina]|uniref:Uncharacterized protein n=1 Tax=Bugula neritina TaxID=10212 RepID=A0A7J7KGJ4_BUGNE|nr:hypothetical protein EB796_004668 [Bugula neritina]
MFMYTPSQTRLRVQCPYIDGFVANLHLELQECKIDVEAGCKQRLWVTFSTARHAQTGVIPDSLLKRVIPDSL